MSSIQLDNISPEIDLDPSQPQTVIELKQSSIAASGLCRHSEMKELGSQGLGCQDLMNLIDNAPSNEPKSSVSAAANDPSKKEKSNKPESDPEKNRTVNPDIDPELAAAMKAFREQIAKLEAMGVNVKFSRATGQNYPESDVHLTPDVDPESIATWKGNLNFLYAHLTRAIINGGSVGVYSTNPGAAASSTPDAVRAEKEAQKRANDPEGKGEGPITLEVPPISVRLEVTKDKDGNLQLSIVAYDWSSPDHPELCRSTLPFEPAVNNGLNSPYFKEVDEFIAKLAKDFPHPEAKPPTR